MCLQGILKNLEKEKASSSFLLKTERLTKLVVYQLLPYRAKNFGTIPYNTLFEERFTRKLNFYILLFKI